MIENAAWKRDCKTKNLIFKTQYEGNEAKGEGTINRRLPFDLNLGFSLKFESISSLSNDLHLYLVLSKVIISQKKTLE